MIKGYIVKPFMLSKEHSKVYNGCVFGAFADSNGVETKLDIRTSHVVAYDVNKEKTEVMITTRSGSDYKIFLSKEGEQHESDKAFLKDLLEYMGDY